MTIEKRTRGRKARNKYFFLQQKKINEAKRERGFLGIFYRMFKNIKEKNNIYYRKWK